jgi:hypothetical protein
MIYYLVNSGVSTKYFLINNASMTMYKAEHLVPAFLRSVHMNCIVYDFVFRSCRLERKTYLREFAFLFLDQLLQCHFNY